MINKLIHLVKRLWFVLLLGPVPFYWLKAPGDFEDHIRWHATALQMLGLWLVYQGLVDTAERFKVPTPWATVMAWVGSLAPKEPSPAEPITMSVSARMAGLSGSVRVTATVVAPDDAQRIKELENAVAAIRADLERVHESNTLKFKQLDKQVGSLAAELNKDINEVKSVMHAQTAGGLGESFIGLAWVAFGTVLGGFTTEAAKLLHWVWA